MQVQHSNNSNTISSVSAKQLLIDEIYAPQPSKESAKVLVMKTNQPSKSSADTRTTTEPHIKSQKSEFLRSLEAYGDCV